MVKTYLEALIIKENNVQANVFNDGDLDEEIPDYYSIEFNTQILHKHAILDNEEVEIIKTHFTNDIHNPDYFHSVLVKTQNNKKIKVNIQDLKFKYNTID